MAEPIPFEAFEKSEAKPAAKSVVPFDQFDGDSAQKPGVVSFDAFDKAEPIEERAKKVIVDAIPDSAKSAASELAQGIAKSPVGKALTYLNKPLQAATAVVVDAVDIVKPGIKKELNPKNEWFPDIAYHDVLNYVAPSNDEVEKLARDYGITGNYADAVRLAYAGTKAGLGLAANVLLDPLQTAKVGQLTKASQAARAAGDVLAAERNLVELAIPMTGKSIEVSAAPVQRAAKKFGQVVSATPVIGKAVDKTAEVAARTMRAFDYKTGDPEIDLAASMHAGLKRGDQAYIYEEFFQPLRKKGFSPEENKLLAQTVELTPNNADGDVLASVARKEASKLGLKVPEERIDDIVESASRLKLENQIDFAERSGAGLNDHLRPGQGVIEGYLRHEISPQARAYIKKNQKMAVAVEEAGLANEVGRLTKGGYLSSFDNGKFQRGIKDTLAEANAIMKDRTGVDAWFIEDPIVATAMKRAQTRKLIRDKELLEKISDKGMLAKEARELGLKDWKKIDHPDFTAKGIVFKRGKLDDLVFPPEIADKMGYYVTPREVGNIKAAFDSYNRVFRTFALAKPDYYAQNFGENMVKNYVQGVKISDYVDAAKLASGKGFITINGKPVPTQEVLATVKKWGIDSGGQFKEGLNDVLYTGKKMFHDKVLKGGKDGVKAVFSGLHHFGEKGENYTRRALFINRLKSGYKPEIAALEVEKFLFDFSRNSPVVNELRRFYDPFIQAAIKTAEIAPEMVGAKPAAYNFLHNNMLSTLEAAFQDPVTAAEVKMILPEYRQFQDPIAGPLLNGNNWLARVFAGEHGPEAMKAKIGFTFQAPIGLDILNRFMLWDNLVMKQAGGGSAPLFRATAIALFGKDTFTGKDIDPVQGSADMSRRMTRALDEVGGGMLPFPNTYKLLKQKAGIGDPRYFTPEAVLALHGSFGKFARVENLDKEYMFKVISMASARKQLMMDLKSAASREAQGKTLDQVLSDKPGLAAVHRAYSEDSGSVGSFRRIQDLRRKIQVNQMAYQGLSGNLTAQQIVKNIRQLDKDIDQLNKSYVVAHQARMMAMKKARDKAKP